MSVITFKPNDHTKITTDFERYEFACPCGCTAQMIDPELVQKMQTIRTKLGKAIKVTSGYRCVKHNADPKVGGSRTSRHLYGIAADWRTRDRSVNPVALGIIAAAQGFGAVGIYWHDKAAIVHTDTRGRKAGEVLDFGGLLGYGPIMPVNSHDPSVFINRGGRLPAPMQSLKN